MLISPDMVLGRYKIRATIGQGGMGEVFLAEDSELERQVAIKVLLPDVAKDNDRVRRFIQEAKTVSALNHPNILTIYEIGKFDELRFIATEFIKGKTLRDRLREEPISLLHAVEIAMQIAAALDAAHGTGIVHRDIKPENIMIREDGFIKVLDFGLAKLVEPKDEAVDSEGATLAQLKTIRGTLVGTVNYMSPEQARGKEVDTRTDIWSLGVVLYEMIARRAPFKEDTVSDTIASILRSEPEPLGDAVPVELNRIVRKALEKDRGERYQTAKDLLLDLKTLKRELEFENEIRRTGSGVPRSEYASTDNGIERTTSLRANLTTQHSLQPSSAEYVVSEIVKHSRISLGVIAVLLIGAVAALSYVFFWNAGPRPVTSVAVMPFTNVGGDAKSEYLSDGVSEMLINDLSQLPQLKVISRSSTFKYKGTEIDPEQVAQALGVEAVVMGRIIPRGEYLQISVELVNASDRTQMWGDTFNRHLSDIQSVQQEIARTISEKLRLRLTGAQETQIAKQPSENPQAYQFYLNGIYYSRQRGSQNLLTAIEYFNKAIALDPDFAAAYAELGSSYSLLVGSNVISVDEAKQRAQAAVEKALSLDETLPDAHLVLGRMKNDRQDWSGAEASLRRAIELNPSLVAAHNQYAFYLTVHERHGEALAEIKLAQALDPLNIRLKSTEGAILYAARRSGEAVQVLQAAIKADPQDIFARYYLALALADARRYDEAVQELNAVTEMQGESTETLIYLGRVYAQAGRVDEARAMLKQVVGSDKYVSPAEIAAFCSVLGENDKAFEYLEKAFAEKDLQLQFLRIDPAYDNIRNDARFKDLLRRAGIDK